jgi:predicted transcriptional regulator
MQDIDALIGFVSASNRRKQVLEALSDNPKRPMELCHALHIETGNMARLLFQLEKKQLIHCLTPEKRSWRVYAITPLGKRVLCVTATAL